MRCSFVILFFLALSGCGLRGKLERPPPLWGKDDRTQAEKQKQSTPQEKKKDKSPRQESGAKIKAEKP